MTDHFCPIDHIAIDVVDFDTALAFFQDVFSCFMIFTDTDGNFLIIADSSPGCIHNIRFSILTICGDH